MTSKPPPPCADEEHTPGEVAALPSQTPSGGPAVMGAMAGAGGKPLGHQPAIARGAGVVGAPPGATTGLSLPSMSARAAIGRSLPMLHAVRGTVTVSIVLGFIVTALPFVVSAAQGPFMVLFGRAVECGGLRHAWRLSAALFNRAQPGAPAHDTCIGAGGAPTPGTSGLLHWLATPLPFAVLLTIWGGALVLTQVLGFGRAWADAQVQWKLVTDIRQRVHDHVESLSLDFFTGTPSGMLMQRVQTETTGVQQMLSECLIPPFIDATVLVIVLAYMLVLSWPMTIVTLILSPLALMTLVWGGKRLQAATRQMVMSARQLNGELGETINGISDIQVFDAEKRRSERFYEVNKAVARNTSLVLVWAQIGLESTGIFVALSTVLVLIMGVVFSASFALPSSSLLQFVFFVPAMFAPAQRIIHAYTKYKSVIPQVASTYQLLDTKSSVQERPEARDLGQVHGNIVLEDVVFGYSPGQKVLNGLSLSIKEGETVALVGAIGSGKSTVFNLLLRFLDPERGRILLDGQDISAVTLNSLREQVSKLSQFPFYLKDTIRENVRLARQDATDAEIEEACQQAHIHDVIVDRTKIADGYDTIVDVQVPSGGQKRLIALARCLLRKPEVLLLDEPTENLDADQRVLITRVIRGYARDRTCVVISHDMDFIKAVADRIIVLHEGRVTEEGTHEELIAGGRLYKELHDAQNINPALVRGAAPPPRGHAALPTGAAAAPSAYPTATDDPTPPGRSSQRYRHPYHSN
jgi:ATP-binding cassette subfamily B protein